MNIEEFIISSLSGAFTCPVTGEVAEDFTSPCIVVDLTGQTREGDHVYRSTVAVQSYHDSKAEAAELNTDVIEAMFDLIDDAGISRIIMAGNAYFPDTTNKRRRYQTVWQITHY